MKKSKPVIILSAILAMIIAITGCQSVGGLDINKALLSNLTAESYEGSSSVSVKLLWDEDAVELAEEIAMLKLFDDINLDVYDFKKQDMNTMSMKGTFHFLRGEIPFAMNLSGEQIAIEVEGAEQPVVIDLMGKASSKFDDEYLVLQEELAEKSPEIIEGIGTFLVKQLTNPNSIQVSSGIQLLNGESIFVHKLSAEIYADEILDLVKITLENILNDEEGLKELLGQLYDVVLPIIEPIFLQDENISTDPTLAYMLPFIQNKDLAVEFLYTQIQVMLESVVEDYDDIVGMLSSQDDVDFFNKQSYFKTDLYIDNSFNIRKQDFELVLEPILQESMGIQGVQITGSSEIWKVNEPVSADVMDTTEAFIVDSDTTPVHILKQLESSSVLYKLLYDDLKITRTELQLIMSDSGTQFMQNRPYIVNQTTMVPVRFISEELNADVLWNHETKEITVIDILTEKKIVFTVDSDTAYVDGVVQPLPTKVVLKNGSSFVPVRFIVESLDGKVDWNGEFKMVTITKD